MAPRGVGVEPVVSYGVDSSGLAAMEAVAAHMTSGTLDGLESERRGLAMGTPLARHLGIETGDPVTLIMSAPSNDTIVPRLERFTLVGTFEVGAELDYGLVLIGLDEIQRRGLSQTGRVGVRLKLPEPL